MQTLRCSFPQQQRAAVPRAARMSGRLLTVVPRCSSSGAAAAGSRPSLPSAALLQLTSAAAGVVRAGVASMHAAAAVAARQVAEQDVNAQIRDGVKQMRVLALVAPFAAVSGGTDTFMIITRAVASFIKLYLLLLFVRVLLSWFPTFAWWENQPFAALRQVGYSGARGSMRGRGRGAQARRRPAAVAAGSIGCGANIVCSHGRSERRCASCRACP